jgi:hypothetical protein
MLGKNLDEEDAKRHKTVYFSVNNKMNCTFFRFFLSTIWDGLSLKTSQATVPLNSKLQY